MKKNAAKPRYYGHEDPDQGMYHDYQADWDYEVVERPKGKMMQAFLQAAQDIQNKHMDYFKNYFKRFSIQFVKNSGGGLARYVNGTDGEPVVVVDLRVCAKTQRELKDDFSLYQVAITTFMHELRHAMQDAEGRLSIYSPEDSDGWQDIEDEAEEFGMRFMTNLNWYKTSQSNTAKGFRIMVLGEDGDVYSKADNRQHFKPIIGQYYSMPGNGMYMGLTREYAVSNYWSGEREDPEDPHEVVLEFEFDPKDIVFGNMNDEQSEFSVKKAKLVGMEVLTDGLKVEEDPDVPVVEAKNKKKNKKTKDWYKPPFMRSMDYIGAPK